MDFDKHFAGGRIMVATAWKMVTAFCIFVLPVLVAGNMVWHTDAHFVTKIVVPIAAIYVWTLILFPFVYAGMSIYDQMFPESL